METGTRRISAPDRRGRALEIQQGFRRRHPSNVLNRYDGVMKTTSNASSLWEESLIHETKRVELPKDFRPKGDTEGMTNQMGIVNVALDNYKASKNKLQRMYLVGV